MKLSIAALFLSTIGLSSCNMTAGGVDFGKLTSIGQQLINLGTIDAAQEQVLGDDFAAMLLGATRLHPNQALQTYVNQVGRYLASHSDRPELSWTFAVLDTPDLNAFAIPGGYVFVTSGLLANLSSEAELAVVLAHEISHITERHQLLQLERDKSKTLLTSIADAAVTYHAEKRAGPDAYKNRQIAEGILKAGHQLYTQGLSRDDELAADQLALRLAARAGYDPYALAAVLQQLDSVQAGSSAFSLILATHPAPVDRLNQLEQTLSQLEQQYGTSSKLMLAERYTAVLRAK